MTDDDFRISESVERLRQLGLVTRECETAQEGRDWCTAMKRVCRAEHLRVRTSVWRDRPDDIKTPMPFKFLALVQHVDHVITDEFRRTVASEMKTRSMYGQRASQPAAQRATLQAPNVFMEITRREDIGADLNAPLAARGGGVTASYRLVPTVHPGDVVIHYDSRREAVVGVSVATGPAEPSPVFWAARGSYARRAGEKPRWLSGIRVPLGGYRELPVPLPLAQIRDQKDALLAIRERLQQSAGGQAIYFPWIPYQDTLRTFQSYLVKVPREVIELLPVLRAAVDQTPTVPLDEETASPVEETVQAVEGGAGKIRRSGRGQGFQLDQATKVAVEVCAMNAAADYYAPMWEVEDVHGNQSYDLVCRRGQEVKHVEVKGTVTSGSEVILTPNEVRHARENASTALFILSDVKIERADDGSVTASGGVRHVYDPWVIDDGTLAPLGFRYQVPASPSAGD